MALTVKQTIELVERQQFTKAVWEELNNFLSKALTMETSPASIIFYIGGEQGKRQVPEEIIIEIMDRISQEEVEPLTAQIEALENRQVEETTDEQADEGPEKESRPRGKEPFGKGGQGPQKPQGIRPSIRQPRRAAPGSG